MEKLENIGFYTLTDARAQLASVTSPLWRCEMLVTKRCNFKCPYCRSTGPEKDLSFDDAKYVVDQWAQSDIHNVRYSGGEPTVWSHLVDLVQYTKLVCKSIEHIAISTNGSASTEYYQELLDAGVNDFSISLDACCASTGDMMSGVSGAWNKVIENIKYLSSITYVTVGVVLTEENVNELADIIDFAHSLGVSDIRIISAAQWNDEKSLDIGTSYIREKHPILGYRLEHLKNGRNVRGIGEFDCHTCPLVLDDMAVMNNKHYPCIIYMREGGDAIGDVGPNMRKERERWFQTTDTYNNPICRKNCLDVCIDYNNKWKNYHKGE